jgi:hypothetical protein
MWAIWNSRNSWTHDKGNFDPVHSLKMAKEAIAVLEIPQKHAAILPGHGWRRVNDIVGHTTCLVCAINSHIL